MNFKEAVESGDFKWEMPEFVNRPEELKENRMAGDYMKEFFKKTEYTPKKHKTAEENMAGTGVRSPFDQYIEDQKYKQALADQERRKDWKATTPVSTTVAAPSITTSSSSEKKKENERNSRRLR